MYRHEKELAVNLNGLAKYITDAISGLWNMVKKLVIDSTYGTNNSDNIHFFKNLN